GLFWGFLFFRVHHIGHLQILSCQWMPAAIVCLARLWRYPTVRHALGFAAVVVVQALVSWYLAVAMGVALGVVALTQPWRRVFAPRVWRGYALAALTIAAGVLPFAWPYRSAFADSSLAVRRALVDTAGDAVRLRDYLVPPVSTLAGAHLEGNPYTI